MKNAISIVLSFIFFVSACSANSNQNSKNQTNMIKSKSLDVFFSHAGENYSVGNIEVGNTKIVADYISELIGADQFEIVTHKYDGLAYTPLTHLAQEEQNNDERPPFDGKLENLDARVVV